MLEKWLMPLLILCLLACTAWKRLPAYDLFIAGAKEGLSVALNVLPNLAAMLAALSMMRASGLLDALCDLCAPALAWMKLPKELAPLLLMRPLSGSGSLAVLETLLAQHGPDSRTGLLACVVMGSGETIFYTLCVYMSGVSQQRTAYAAPCALLGTIAAVLLAGWLL